MNPLANLTPGQLRQAAAFKERIASLQKALNKLLGAPVQAAAPKAAKRPKRKMSAAGRRRLSALAKARWAKVKAQGKTKL